MKENKINTTPKLKKRNGVWAVLTAAALGVVLGSATFSCLVHYVPTISKVVINEEFYQDYNEYKSQIDSLTNELTLVKKDLINEQNINASNLELLKNKQTELTEKTSLISSLQIKNAENEGKITAYEQQINKLKEQLKIEQEKCDANEQTILSLNNQISTLTTEKQNLENINVSNINTINSLNSQVLNLNNTIAELTNSVNANLKTIQQLNTKINELQNTIKYYELLVAEYNFEDKAVVTFKYDGNVHSLQVINKGTSPTITTPVDTDYIKFNYWQTEDGVEVDLTTFKPTENVTLIANLTYYYDVKYFNGEEIYNSTIVEKGQTVKNLQLPNVDQNKRHIGWSLDGINLVDISQLTINENTNLYAVFEIANQVKFYNENTQIGNTQNVFKNEQIVVPENPVKPGYIFVGWTIDGINTVDFETFELTQNVTFKAQFRINTFIISFMDGDLVVETQTVLGNEKIQKPNYYIDTKIKEWKILIDNELENFSFETFNVSNDVTLVAVEKTSFNLGYYQFNDNYCEEDGSIEYCINDPLPDFNNLPCNINEVVLEYFSIKSEGSYYSFENNNWNLVEMVKGNRINVNETINGVINGCEFTITLTRGKSTFGDDTLLLKLHSSDLTKIKLEITGSVRLCYYK